MRTKKADAFPQTIDAVAVTRKIRDAHFQRLRGKSLEDRIRFYREKSQRLRDTLATEGDSSDPE